MTLHVSGDSDSSNNDARDCNGVCVPGVPGPAVDVLDASGFVLVAANSVLVAVAAPAGVEDACGVCDGVYCSSDGTRRGANPRRDANGVIVAAPPAQLVNGVWECPAGHQVLERGDGPSLSCVDCLGAVDGSAKYDRCGICEDGESCNNLIVAP